MIPLGEVELLFVSLLFLWAVVWMGNPRPGWIASWLSLGLLTIIWAEYFIILRMSRILEGTQLPSLMPDAPSSFPWFKLLNGSQSESLRSLRWLSLPGSGAIEPRSSLQLDPSMNKISLCCLGHDKKKANQIRTRTHIRERTVGSKEREEETWCGSYIWTIFFLKKKNLSCLVNRSITSCCWWRSKVMQL